MEIIGYFASIVMGLTLGLIGGGGSILTVPILVYLFHVDPVLATAYSLFVVGLTSAIGSFTHFRQGNVDLGTGLWFGLPSIAAVYIVRKLVVPAIPERIFTWGSFTLSKPLLFLLLFALLMVLASISMIRKSVTVQVPVKKKKFRHLLILTEGFVVGALTGLVGAGGGFLIIPALVLLAGLPMKQAIGTSLLIIALKSLIGFTGDLGSGQAIDFGFTLVFSALAIAGIIAGSYLTRYISNEKLKPAFGWFVLIMGLYIFGKELLF